MSINFDSDLGEREFEVYKEYCAQGARVFVYEFDKQIAHALLIISDADAIIIVQAKHLAELLCSVGCPYKNEKCDIDKCIDSIKKFQEFLEKSIEKHPEWFIID